MSPCSAGGALPLPMVYIRSDSKLRASASPVSDELYDLAAWATQHNNADRLMTSQCRNSANSAGMNTPARHA
eukprot:2867748-Amphidinium_carterae.1